VHVALMSLIEDKSASVVFLAWWRACRRLSVVSPLMFFLMVGSGSRLGDCTSRVVLHQGLHTSSPRTCEWMRGRGVDGELHVVMNCPGVF